MSNVIKVTACDNELIILAYQWGASYQLCRILSGNFMPVNFKLDIKAGAYQGSETIDGVTQPINQQVSTFLPVGNYSLLLLGIDWGGPAQFTVEVNGTPYTLLEQPNGDGLVFNPGPVQLTVL